MRLVFPLLVLTVVFPSVHLPAQELRRPCTTDLPRGVPAAVGPVYRDCDVDKTARLRSEGRVSYARPEKLQGDWVCEQVVTVFVVDTAGLVDLRTVRVLAATREEWAAAVVSSLAQTRYRPAVLNGRAVRQVVRYGRSALIPKRTDLTGSRISTAGQHWKRC